VVAVGPSVMLSDRRFGMSQLRGTIPDVTMG